MYAQHGIWMSCGIKGFKTSLKHFFIYAAESVTKSWGEDKGIWKVVITLMQFCPIVALLTCNKKSIKINFVLSL